MQTTKSIGKLAVSAMLALALGPLGAAVARAQEVLDPIFLLDATCVSAGPGRWSYDVKNVSVGRAVYKSYWYMGPGSDYSSMTCRIRPQNPEKERDYNFQTLYLEFGMRDNDAGSPGATVTVYLDGRRQESKSVIPGQKSTIQLNITNVNNISIETECNEKVRYCDRVYFLKGLLEPAPLPANPDTSQPIPPPPSDGSTNQTPPPPPPSNSPGELPNL